MINIDQTTIRSSAIVNAIPIATAGIEEGPCRGLAGRVVSPTRAHRGQSWSLVRQLPTAVANAQESEQQQRGVSRFQDAGDGRRSHFRFPIDLPIRCRPLTGHKCSSGRIRDISSGGIRFVLPEVLAPGTSVELAIDWPVLHEGSSRLLLKCQGRIIRCHTTGTVVKIERHQFDRRSTLYAVETGFRAAVRTR